MCSRGAGLPGHANAASDFAVTAPSGAASHEPRDLVAVPERARRGDDRVRQHRAGPSRDASGRPASERRFGRDTLRPRAGAGRRRGTPAASAPVASAAPTRRSRPTAARAAATVVTHGMPRAVAVRRMWAPSARGPGPAAC